MTIAALLLIQVIGTYAAPAALAAISPIVTETGKIALSVDGSGTNAAAGTLRVQKPAGATVRKAFLAAATTGFSGATLATGDIKLDANNVAFSDTIASSISSNNYWGNVTAIVKPKVDAALPGLVTFSVTEANTGSVDGEILAVIFDDPSQPTNNTVVLFFGAQLTTGDDFNVLLASPLDKTDPNLKLDLSLGISFGAQPSSQFSPVDVNGTRMTSCAGGQDDGALENGALITVGGIGDTNANPAPTCSAGDGPRIDDELYDLLPFVKSGDTTIKVHTLNPSNDDNIFFAALNLTSTIAVAGEGIVLSPLTATNPTGTPHTVTATLQNAAGAPIVGKTVTFTVTAGPNAGLTGTGVTDATGKATFTYTSTAAGTDTITASFVNSLSVKTTSNSVTKIWTAGDAVAPTCAVTAVLPGPPKQIQVTVQDTGSGLASITVVSVTNATVSIPTFTAGILTPIVVTVTKTDQLLAASVTLKATDVAGNVTTCDPVVTEVIRADGQPLSQTFTGLTRAESKIDILNGTPGAKAIQLNVNGKKFEVANLADGASTSLNVASAMKAGDNNTITVTIHGKPGASATVVIHD